MKTSTISRSTDSSAAAPGLVADIVRYVKRKGYNAAAARFEMSQGRLHNLIAQASQGRMKRSLAAIIIH
jgi:hypothetical protein